MAKSRLSDSEAKAILKRWPQRPNVLWDAPAAEGSWIRAQPKGGKETAPTLQVPGAQLYATQPDGLWIYLCRTGKYADVVAIEVCGNVQNLNDKRSRYSPTLHATMLDVGRAWLNEDIRVAGGKMSPRWKVAEVFKRPARADLRRPVRFLRVLYALKNSDYNSWVPGHVPSGYEFFCRHSSLSSYKSQKFQEFLRRMARTAHFYPTPSGGWLQ